MVRVFPKAYYVCTIRTTLSKSGYLKMAIHMQEIFLPLAWSFPRDHVE